MHSCSLAALVSYFVDATRGVNIGVGADQQTFLVIVTQRIDYKWHQKETRSKEKRP
jgi:hypothetical protein